MSTTTIRAFLGAAGLTDVGYRFYTQANPVAARVTAGIVDEGEGWYSAAGVSLIGDHVRWDSPTAPDYKPRQYFSDTLGLGVVGSSTLPSTSPAVATSADTRTVSFLDLLQRTARRCGLDPATLGSEEAEALCAHISAAVDKAWRHYDWPDTILTEQRALRPLFSLAATYALGTQVYDEETDAYYEAVQDGFAGQAIEDAAYWDPIDTLDRSLSLISVGDTPIGETLGIWDSDPGGETIDTRARGVGFHFNGAELRLAVGAPTTVWVRFRRPPPRFTAAAWSDATAYASGDLAYLEPHVYVALAENTGDDQGPDEAPERWSAQVVPEILKNAITRAAKSEWLSAQGQDERAIALENKAEDDLDDMTAVLSQQQGQGRTYAVRTRTTSRYGPRAAAY